MAEFDHVGPNFTRLMETLLAGKAICPYRYETLNGLLADEQGTDRVKAEVMLAALGRRLACQDGIYYAVYDGKDDEVTEQVTRRFAWYRTNARLLCEFFDLAQQALRRDALVAGERFSFAELNERIASAHNHTERLMQLFSATANRRSREPEPEAALRYLIDKLVDFGFLHQVSAQPQQYVLTGEVTLFEEWKAFVAELEDIDLEAEEGEGAEGPGQEALL